MIPDGKRGKQEGKNEDSQPDESSPTSSRETILQRDAREKNKIKGRADERNRAKEHHLRIGDLVLLKQNQRNKLYLPWDPSPYRVTGIKGSRITAKRRGVTVTRNSSHFKRVIPYLQEVDDPYFSSNEEEEEGEIAAEREGIENDIERDQPDDEIGDVQQEDRPRRYPRRENRDIRPQYYAEQNSLN
jgi:hypothetical protein